jgi:hypothetical protein
MVDLKEPPPQIPYSIELERAREWMRHYGIPVRGEEHLIPKRGPK